jgi:DNA polymerase III alpha subunit (gram-positive type)
MPSYYLDIETTGLDPNKDKIITIQYQELDRNTGEAIGELVVLKEWESSEKDMIKQFVLGSKILDPYAFSFVPVGYNLTFEHNFLKTRARVHELTEIDILNHPFIDLRAIGVLMNKGEFKGSGLDQMTGKKNSGSGIPAFYEKKEYQKIIDYIKNETEEFIKFNVWLYKEMPKLHEIFKRECGVGNGK